MDITARENMDVTAFIHSFIDLNLTCIPFFSVNNVWLFVASECEGALVFSCEVSCEPSL
jgi:hypothetical protein